MSAREDREAAACAVHDVAEYAGLPRGVRAWVDSGEDQYGHNHVLARVAALLASHTAAAVERAEREGYARGLVATEREVRLESSEGNHGPWALEALSAGVQRIRALRSRLPRAEQETACPTCERRVATDEERAHRGDCECAGCDGEACFGADTAGCRCAKAALRVSPAAGRAAASAGEPAVRDAWWHCAFCGDRAPADEPYEVGDKEPCTECGEGTSHVMTVKQAAEAEIRRSAEGPKRSYTDDPSPTGARRRRREK